MTDTGFLVAFFIVIFLVIIFALVAVIGAVTSAVAGINDDEDEIERWKEVLNRVKVLGLYPDVENKRVYLLRNVPDVYINTIATKINKTGNGYKISFILFGADSN